MPTQNAWRYCHQCHAMFFDGYPDKGRCAGGGGHEAAGYNFALPHDITQTPKAQTAWRYCGKCHGMFFDGYPDKGRCPAGGGHEAIGYEFVLPHDVPGTGNAQTAWRYCGKCHGMFFDGYPDKGRCAGASPQGHVAAGFEFVLPHDVPGTSNAQNSWRFCQKCHGMFYDGYPDKGRCPIGGGHEAAGYDFVLPHDVPGTANAQTAWRYCGKCHVMFFDGSTDKGVCPVGGGHEAIGYEFSLPHDVPGTPNAQNAWRYCVRCHCMFFDGYADKGRCPAWQGHEAIGYEFSLPHDVDGPFVFEGQIVTGGLAALGGWVRVTVNPDGSVRWLGHAHDSGADGYDFGISALVRTPTGRGIALAHSGHVGGTFTSGSRDHDWDTVSPPDAGLAGRFAEFALGVLQTNLEYSSDIGSALEKAVGWLIRFGAGTALGPAGAVVFIGVEAGSLISTGSLVPGARVVEGILWMAGPANTLFAIAAEGIASLGSRTRELTQEEYDWANGRVFLGALPPRDQIVLSDTIGGGNRAFTFPRFDGKITLNMGPGGFDDPRGYPSGQYGQTFIHELVHACQIRHTSMDLSLLADALASKVCEATDGNPYAYGAAGSDYSSFNLEQQAQIVSDWFARHHTGGDPADNFGLQSQVAINDPYFRYISDNVRVGRF